MQTIRLEGPDRVRVAAEAGRSVKTVVLVYRGEGNAYSRASVIRAAERLGLPLPPAAPRQTEVAD